MKAQVSGLFLLFLCLTAFGCQSSSSADSSEDTAQPLTVYLVRHAEKADDSADPALTEAGIARAQALADTLQRFDIEYVHTTDYVRTRETAAPTAMASGLSAELYDPRDLAGFAAELKEQGGTHLVVGHSNTTPALVEALGGKPGPPIGESEYNRLYVVAVTPTGLVQSMLLRYGANTEK